MIPPQYLRRSEMAASACDTMLVIGTSAGVQPAASIPLIAKQAGAKVIEINLERTFLSSDYSILGKAGKILKTLTIEIERLLNI
jgi:NAD-dependent deacetylase